MGDTEKKPAGAGFITTCTTCGRRRVIYRDAIMRGDWQRCPHCAQDKEDC